MASIRLAPSSERAVCCGAENSKCWGSLSRNNKAVCSFFIRRRQAFVLNVKHAKSGQSSEECGPDSARDYRAGGALSHGVWPAGFLQPGRSDRVPAIEWQGGGDDLQPLRGTRGRTAHARGHSQTER